MVETGSTVSAQGVVKREQPRWVATVGEIYSHLRAAGQIIWAASPRGTLLLAALAILGGLVLPLMAWTKKLLIDDVVVLFNAGSGAWDGLWVVLPLLLLMLGWLFVNNAIGLGRALAEKNLQAKLSLRINSLTMNKALSLDLMHFENAEFYDKLQNARNQTDHRALEIVTRSFGLLQTTITFLIFAALLVRFSPWLLVILLCATLPSFAAQNKFGQLTFRLLNGQAPERRRLDYFADLLTVDRYIKEIKLFRLGHLFLERYTELFWRLFRADMDLAKRRSLVSLAWGSLGLCGYLLAVGWIILRTIDGTITFGDAILYLEVFEQSHYIVQDMLGHVIRLFENGLFVSNVSTFLKLEPEIKAPLSPQPLPAKLQKGIELRNVSFKYPGQSNWALQEINLTLHPGEKLAVVGLNGAGKTTLTKLITRLYDPIQGQILIDGVDLRTVDPAEWHEKVGVLFQDFTCYQLTAAENIGFGQLERMGEMDVIRTAAQKGGAHEILAALPNGFETTLGKWFEGGHELSRGQWQKVALGRLFMREADILILDEPTAWLDAEQEYQMFQRFRELTEDKMSILISHRFSTVRMADRIAVIDGGRLAELGNHDELMVQDGAYANLFRIQSEGYL